MRPDNRTRLTPVELAEAAILGDIAFGLQVLGMMITPAAALQWLSVIPFAVLAHRRRRRVVAISAVAIGAIAFLIGGIALDFQIWIAAVIGQAVGTSRRSRFAWARTAFRSTVFAGAPVALLALGLLEVFSKARTVAIKQVVAVWHGVATFFRVVAAPLTGLGHLLAGSGRHVRTGWQATTGHGVEHAANALVRSGRWLGSSGVWLAVHWWSVVPISIAASVVLLALFTHAISAPVLRRVTRVLPDDQALLETVLSREDAQPAPCSPVPVELRNVRYRYEGADGYALDGVSVRFGSGTLSALVGTNGSGKSTLARVVAGIAPTDGEVLRPGAVGLGAAGGTAVVFQRPESQVLGERVADDVVWGLHDTSGVDIGGLLARVGLGGMEERETSGLSGGELQRLALAAALVRRPSLVVSDESTAMLDAEGRRSVMELLRGLPEQQVSVLHVTHIPEEAATAGTVVRLSAGRVDDSEGAPAGKGAAGEGAPAAESAAETEWDAWRTIAHRPPRGGVCQLVALEGVGHVFAKGTPWAARALVGVDLTVSRGEAILVTGPNGSGKSTLAWILAGLLAPTEGAALWTGDEGDGFAGPELWRRVGTVAMVFQHARLQLIRQTVEQNLRPVADRSADSAERLERALGLVGFDPATMRSRNVASLSGGELRRVALASVLASDARLVVLDEPLAGLDVPSRISVLDALGRLRAEGVALVVISHDLEGLDAVADRVVVLDTGRIVDPHRAAGARAVQAQDGPGERAGGTPEDGADTPRGVPAGEPA